MKYLGLLLSTLAGLVVFSLPGVADDRCTCDNGNTAGSSSGTTPDEQSAYAGGKDNDRTAVESVTALRDMRMYAPPLAQWQFRNAMTKLWEDHITYTRNFIVAAAAGSQATDAIVARLMQNQVDIGDAIKPYYGADAGNQLTKLLQQHIAIAGEVVTDAKSSKTDALADANQRWSANADEIAAFLSKANPQAWPQAAVQQMMHEHLNLTTQEAKSELTGDWDGSIAAYDEVHQQILKMSGTLADGIIAQFPDKF